MGIIRLMEKGGEDYKEYKKALKKAKEAIDEICELTDEMEDTFSSRGYGMRGGMSRRDDDYEMYDRRRR